MAISKYQGKPDDFLSLVCLSIEKYANFQSEYAIFGYPNHSNVGDSAIWQGELKILKYKYGTTPVTTIDERLAPTKFPRLSEKVTIYLHGGGNLGDIWQRNQYFREQVLIRYPKNQVIQLPQSIHFIKNENASRCKSIFSLHSKFVLMVRDQKSYELAKNLHTGALELVPDSALALGTITRERSSVNIFALLREDKERANNGTLSHESEVLESDWIREPLYLERVALGFMRILERGPMTVKILSGLRTRLFDSLSNRRLKRGLTLLSQGRVVITDRLHAHILASLLGIPHVSLDNTYGKLSNFRRTWVTCEPHLCFEAKNLEDAYEKAKGLISYLGPDSTQF
jgi:pyruvyl transferase EpsO